MENPFKRGNIDLGCRVLVRVDKKMRGLPVNGNIQEFPVVGHETHWVPETGVGVPRDEATLRVRELKREQSLVARLLHPNAKIVRDLV